MPSTDRKLELKAKTSVAQNGSQPFVYAKGLKMIIPCVVLPLLLLELGKYLAFSVLFIFINFLPRSACGMRWQWIITG